MRYVLRFLGAASLAALLATWPGQAAAQGPDSPALRRAVSEFARLRADLDRINAEVAQLKRADPTVRNDYRLRERMADAEALALKVTQAEAKLRAQGWVGGAVSDQAALVAPPQALPQDGSVELEAKAGLFADQARKLDRQASLLAKAAGELRIRRTLRRRAGAWDRDPFSGLETSKRSLAVSAPTQKIGTAGPGTDSPLRGGNGASTTQTAAVGGGASTTGGASASSSTLPPVLGPAATSDSATKEATVASEAATSAKTSPLTQSLDRPSFEQHLYLDSATVAELRHTLGAPGAASDPDALDRAAATLHARARALNAQAQALLVRSRAP